jgi:branched-chain amino acid transport system permease protein
MLQLIVNGLCKGGIYALTAIGFGLVYSSIRVLHVAHAGVFVVAGYGLYVGLTLLGLPLWAALVGSALAAVGAGLIIEQFVYWPLSGSASSAVVMISSLGTQIVLVNIIAAFFGTAALTVRSVADPMWHLGNASLTRVQFAQFVCGLIGTAILAIVLRKTLLGKNIRALADDPELATVTGIPVRRTRFVVLGLGSLFAAAGACLLALDVGIGPYSGFPMMLIAAVACIIGGLHRLVAPALGAFVLGLIQSIAVWTTSGRWEEATTFAVLIVFLLIRPQGLLGTAMRVDE